MSSPTETGVVLLVEDPFVRNFIRSVLQNHGYSVMEAERPKALGMLEAGKSNVSLIVTNTPALFEPWRDRVAILYTAACPDAELVAHYPRCRILRKPFHPRELVLAVGDLTGRAL